MRYIFWQHHKSLIRNFVFFIIGIYAGIFICLYFHGNQLDNLIDKNEQLNIELNSYKQSNEILEKEKKQRVQPLIRTITFHFMDKLEPFDETELLKALISETHFLIGKRVDNISKNPEFIYHLLNNKVFPAKDKNFIVKVKLISIQSTAGIWVSVKEQ